MKMFDVEFYPTPETVILQMLEGYSFENKTVLEPSAGKGDIIDELLLQGAKVISCEKNEDLAKIVQSKSGFLKHDFFKVDSSEISHINFIVMNPPFSNAEYHILHAWDIAPPGCHIISLVNAETYKNIYSQKRKELRILIDSHGNISDLGNCFNDAERSTNVSVSLIRLQKPGSDYSTEFDGFFMDDEPEFQAEGIIKYDFIRDIVNRYVESVKIFDRQLDTAVAMSQLTKGFFTCTSMLSVKSGDRDLTRDQFKKEMQKSAWKFILDNLDLRKWATSALYEDINNFVENQKQVPFTMKNIYRMLEIVSGTVGQRMDKAILSIFDEFTKYHEDNRLGVPGWKTNSHFLLTKKFIIPNVTEANWSGGMGLSYRQQNLTKLEDLRTVICYLTGKQFDDKSSLWNFIHRRENGNHVKYDWNTWYEWEFLRFKGFKKGTMHFEFLSEDVWGLFNQNVARLKGFPLFEYKKQTAYQERQTGRSGGVNNYDKTDAKVLFTFKTKG